MRGDVIGCARLELQWRSLERNLVERHMADHLASSLIGWQTVEPFFLTIQHTNARGAICFVAAENKEIAINVLHVHLEVGRTLRTIYHHRHAMGMRRGRHLLYRIDGTQHVAHLREAHQFGLVGKQLFVFVEHQLPRIGHRNHFEHDAPLLSLQLPRHNVGMMLHGRHDYFIAFVHERLTIGGGDEVQTLGGAPGENHLSGRAGIDEAAHRLAGSLVKFGGLLRHPVNTTVDVGVDVEVFVTHGIQHAQGFLRGGRIIQVN